MKADEDLTSAAPRYRDLRAAREAEFFKNLMAAGKGKYENPSPMNDPKGGAHPGALDIPQPLIARDSVGGKNRVFPVNAVFTGKDGDREADIEASFRQAEIIAADRFGHYDPVTGNRVGGHLEPVGKSLEAELGFGIAETVADTYLRQGGMLYQYEIQRNELVQYMDLKQVPYVNDYVIDRRTAVIKTAQASAFNPITEAGALVVHDSEFDSITFTPKKWGFLRGMTYESGQLQEPWSVAETIMTDAGIVMGNKFGEQVVVGNSTTPGGNMNTQFQGLKTWASTSGNANNKLLGAHGTFLSAAGNTFGWRAMSTFVTSLPKEYFRSGDRILSMRLAQWGELMGVTDGEDRQLFDSTSSIDDMRLQPFNTRVVLDENWDAGDTTGQIPFFYGDYRSACYIMYGPVRVDYSAEHGFTTDRYYWRFIAHRSFGIVDPNGFYGGRVS